MGALAVVSAPEIVEGELVDSIVLASEASLQPVPILTVPDRVLGIDILTEFLGRRSEHTVRAYEGDLRKFFASFPEYDETKHELNAVATEFFQWPPADIALKVMSYKRQMMAQGLAEATVNRRLSAVSSFHKLAYKLGVAQSNGNGLYEGEKVVKYKDTRGVGIKAVEKLVKLPAKIHGENTIRAKRDEVIIRLLGETGIRRSSITRLNVGDFEIFNRRLWVQEKGKGTQKRLFTLSLQCVTAIHEYLVSNGHIGDKSGALVRSLHHNPEFNNQRLTSHGLWRVLGTYREHLGVDRLSPHQLRHTYITHLIKLFNGNLREVQKVTGHSTIDVIMAYDDNLENKQGEVAEIFGNLFDGIEPDKSRRTKRKV